VSSTRSNYRIRWDRAAYRIEQKARYRCAHEGCGERKDGYEELEAVSVNKDDDGEFRDPNAEGLMDILNAIRDMSAGD